jgi:hypothetical protein
MRIFYPALFFTIAFKAVYNLSFSPLCQLNAIKEQLFGIKKIPATNLPGL